MKKSIAAAVFMGMAALAGSATAADYKIDPMHTAATFEVSHNGASFNRARFSSPTGMIQFDRAAKVGKVDITIDVAKISSGVVPFDNHLRSADIFDVARFPTARFVGDKFAFSGDKVATVSGDLTLRGVTRPVTFKANQFTCYESSMLGSEVCGGDFEATIDRTKFGLDYGVQYTGPAVRLVIQVEGVKQK